MAGFPLNLNPALSIVDVAVSAVIIYRLTLLINRALALRILLCLILLLVCSLSARLAGLQTLYLLLKTAIASSFVVLVVIFQTDIRLAFSTLIRGRQGKEPEVTNEILSSIFLPYSPIHDGAVIIQKGKLTRAGCFLPLTQNPQISKNLGTRHRAAIGLTELVDAVVVVVSEETGSISVVVGGRKTNDLDSATLRRVLRKLIEPRWLS
jgi:diadenylate cyclase